MFNQIIKNRNSLGLLIGISLVAPWSHAQEQHPIDKQTEACIEKNYTTSGMVECHGQAEEQWDKELNRVYNALITKLDDHGRENLNISQRQWLTYRDAEFKAIRAIYSAMDGTMWRVVAASLRVEIVKSRVLTLKEYLENQ